MPVLPLVGSMMCVSRIDHARLLGRLDHRPADAVLDAGVGIEELEFQQHRGPARRDDAVQPHQRRVVRGFNDVGEDFADTAFWGLLRTTSEALPLSISVTENAIHLRM